MSSTAMQNPIPDPAYEAGPLESASGRRSFWQQVRFDMFRGIRARLGAAWIGILAILGVFAPFIANSHPLAVKVSGRWSSPLLQHLSPVDVILPVMAVAIVVVLFMKRLGVWRRLGALLLSLIVVGVLSALFVHPPEAVVYEQYRQMEAAGKVEAIVRVPIPFSPTDRSRDQRDVSLQPPSATHWLGTEDNGADVLSRIVHACRIALAIGFISTGIAVVIGVLIGGIMGYFVGRVDIIGMRIIEIVEAIPTLFLLIMCVAFFGRNLYIMMAIIGATTWTGDARFIRAEFLRLRNQDFVHAAVAAGLPLRSVLFRHMLPNGIAPVLVAASFGVASAILFEATLSFLGLGLVDQPSWGQMLEQARSVGGTFVWWIAVFPGLMIFLTVFAYNLLGESLRDAIDPYLKR